jgi:hypothetical protein
VIAFIETTNEIEIQPRRDTSYNLKKGVGFSIMPYELRWIVPQRIILSRYYGVATPEELNASEIDLKNIVDDDGVGPVYLLVDVREVQFNLMTLKQMSDNAKYPRSQKLGVSVVVTSSALIRFASSLIGQLLHAEVRLFTDYNQALDYLFELEPELKAQQVQTAPNR